LDSRMRAFDDAIEQLLLLKRRDTDDIFSDPKYENDPSAGVIDRITVDSWLDVPENYVPAYLRGLIRLSHRLFPFVGGKGASISLGPFPKGMPIGLITNVDLLGAEMSPGEQEEQGKKAAEAARAREEEIEEESKSAGRPPQSHRRSARREQVPRPGGQKGALFRPPPVPGRACSVG